MLLETATITFPSPDCPQFQIGSAYLDERKKTFLETGKLIKETLVKHPNGLVWVMCRIYADEAAREEWWSDPIMTARSVLVRDYNTRNNIRVTTTVAPL